MFIPFSQRPLVIRFAVLTFYCMTMLVLSVVMVARIGTVIPPPDLPEQYLPGNLLSKADSCRYPQDAFGHYYCEVNLQGSVVTVSSWTGAGTISYTSIAVSKYTIGDLIASWGTPSGIIQTSHYTYVFWGRRSAFLLTKSFQLNSRVDLIVYTQDRKQTSPWRGFTTQAAE